MRMEFQDTKLMPLEQFRSAECLRIDADKRAFATRHEKLQSVREVPGYITELVFRHIIAAFSCQTVESSARALIQMTEQREGIDCDYSSRVLDDGTHMGRPQLLGRITCVPRDLSDSEEFVRVAGVRGTW